jgi:hypothetical protein
MIALRVRDAAAAGTIRARAVGEAADDVRVRCAPLPVERA